MICSDTLPSAGCDGGNLEVKDAGSDHNTTSTDLPATEPLHDEAKGTGVLEAKAEASSSTTPTPPSTLREFEHALRGLGFTRKQAANIAKHGFEQATNAADEADADDTEQLSELLAIVRRNTALLAS